MQQPHPPILIGGQATATLRVVAEHADVWNYPGGDIPDASMRSGVLDRLCDEIGRDPAAITRSLVLSADFDDPQRTRDDINRAIEAGFGHIVLSLAAPFPKDAASRAAEEFIAAA